MIHNLDVDQLKTFLAIADFGNSVRAGEDMLGIGTKRHKWKFQLRICPLDRDTKSGGIIRLMSREINF